MRWEGLSGDSGSRQQRERDHRAIRRAGQNPRGQLGSIGRLLLLLANFWVPLTHPTNCIMCRLFSYSVSYLLWILCIHGFHICEFTDLLSFICRPPNRHLSHFRGHSWTCSEGQDIRVPHAQAPPPEALPSCVGSCPVSKWPFPGLCRAMISHSDVFLW